jgi:hypothetical protein
MSRVEPARTPAGQSDGQPLVAAFTPVPVRPRRDGWTAERQRCFIRAVAETGCVVTAAREAGMAPRSAYRLAARPDAAAFAAAWTEALAVTVPRLRALAFEYATHGIPETVTNKDGEVIAERRRPSERMLIYLLSHLDPHHFGKDAALRPAYRVAPSHEERRAELALLLDEIQDLDDEAGSDAGKAAPGGEDAGPPRAPA